MGPASSCTHGFGDPSDCAACLRRLLHRKFEDYMSSLEAERAAHAAIKERVRELEGALREAQIAMEPFDDVKPRRWETDYTNLARAHQRSCVVLPPKPRSGPEARGEAKEAGKGGER